MKRAIYVHGTAPGEQQRLSALNFLTNAAFVDFLTVGRGMRVLEVGSGLGILAAAVAAFAPKVDVLGVEISSEQLAAAVQAPRVRYLRGDAQALELDDGSFDLAYARYLLEHVADPARVVREMRRVVRRGGRVALCENDITLLRVDPPSPAFEEAWSAFARHQSLLGGDATIGRRLFSLLKQAGFRAIELSVQPELHWYGRDTFSTWIGNLVGNLEGARQGMVAANVLTHAQIDRAVAGLRELEANPAASCTFVWNRAMAVR